MYDDGAVGSSGTWTQYNNTVDPRGLPLDASKLLDGPMTFYASKSFFDPVQSRRIYWGWALVPPGKFPHVLQHRAPRNQ